MENFVGLLKKITPPKILSIIRPVYHFLLAFFAAIFYGFAFLLHRGSFLHRGFGGQVDGQARKMIVIGITGTKGKTTVVELVHEILKETGVKVASLSSLRFRIGDHERKNFTKMTMPGRFFVQKFLYDAGLAGCKYAVLEVTSEGIRQFRHRFVKFDVAAMTNVAPEHIEAHGNFEKYLRSKLDLFWRLSPEGTVLINRDDARAPRFSAAASARKIFYGKEGMMFRGQSAGVSEIKIGEDEITFEIGGQVVFSPLVGEFNFYNILCAVAIGLSQHIAFEKIARAIARVSQIPGRMESIQRVPFAVVVDYAHTPDSLKNVYTFLRYKLQATSPDLKIEDPRQSRGYKLICVLGSAGGGRDKWKRQELGKIAAEFCSEIILTNEDSYDESSQAIIDDIERGVSTNCPPASPDGSASGGRGKLQTTNFKKILDRREAIRTALRSAKPGDTVIITGKGAEPWIMGLQGSKEPWDDREVVREELRKLKAV